MSGIADKFKPEDRPDMSTKVRTYLFSAAGLAVLAAALRTAALFTSFDREIGYFRPHAFLSTASGVMLVLAAVWALTGLWLIPDTALPRFMSSGGKLTAFFAAFTAGVFLVDLIYSSGTFAETVKSGEAARILAQFKHLRYYRLASDRAARFAFILSALALLCSLAAAVYFFMLSLPRAHRPGLAFAGMAAILRLLCGIARIYFDMDLVMNSPNKILLQTAFVCLMLFLLAEIRFLLEEKYARPRLYVVSALLALVTATVAGFSILIGYFGGVLKKFPYFGTEGFLCTALALYVFARLWDYAKLCEFRTAKKANEVPSETETAETAESTETAPAEDVSGREEN